MSGLNVARHNGGLQFHDVRVLQSDLEFVDYHHRSTGGLIKRRRERERESVPDFARYKGKCSEGIKEFNVMI